MEWCGSGNRLRIYSSGRRNRWRVKNRIGTVRLRVGSALSRQILTGTKLSRCLPRIWVTTGSRTSRMLSRYARLWGPTPENLLAIFGTLGVVLGFAFKDYASSLMAGVVALYERPYRNGDWVKIENTYGEVQSLDLRTVQILTPDDTVVAVPHSKMWTTAIHNANGGKRDLMCVADFYLHPDHDGQQVQQNLYDVALASPYLHFLRPVIVVAAEKPWGTHYRLKAYPIDGRDQFLFITDLTLRGKAMLRRLGVAPAAAIAVAPPNDKFAGGIN